MNQFVIMDDGRPDRPAPQPHRQNNFEQRGTMGATAMFVFSPDLCYVVTLYGSRFNNRKVPSGGIEDADAHETDPDIAHAARRGAFRELIEETKIGSGQLLFVDKSSIEDIIRGNMKRYYFIAVAKEKFPITPFRSQEEGKEHYVDRQAWDSVENILRGASCDGESYNTLYSIALVRILQEMECGDFGETHEFRKLLTELAHSGITLESQLKLLQERKLGEEVSRGRGRNRRYL